MAKTPFILWAEAQRAEARAAYEDYMYAAYLEAEDACRGALLNARGARAGIDSLSLFKGNESRAMAYASPELIEFWYCHPRVTVTEFISQYVNLTRAA